ncbi:hypothetical protein Pint_10662 [Pistacia integerrima]|uniref:Uncharacterized protein n=1 Tax=Pistacia integerrima TaxID=434235 RepID=A0ACC0XLV9_9ROSI|nr:hypothetical protein Pint_10662 [Pistacia integerrima]
MNIHGIHGHHKSEVFEHFKSFKILVENQLNKKIKNLRTDNGGEFASHEFCDFLKENGIKRQLTCVRTPQQSGIAEMKNRHIIEAARAMLNEKHLSKVYQAIKCVFVGYSLERKAYRCFDPLNKHIYESRDVQFDEESQWYYLSQGNQENSLSFSLHHEEEEFDSNSQNSSIKHQFFHSNQCPW